MFGAVSGMVACLGAMEAIKVISGFGTPLAGRLLTCDLREMTFRTVAIKRDPHCATCSKPEMSAPWVGCIDGIRRCRC